MSIVSDNVGSMSNWSNFWHVFASRGIVSDSWAFLFVLLALKFSKMLRHDTTR